MDGTRTAGATQALAAAVLFGTGAPLAKLLVPSVEPVVLAALLYLGAGLALVAVRARRADDTATTREAPLTLKDAPLIVGVVVAGGMVGPWLLLVGVRHLPGATASLLLNLEAPLTIILATTLFSEHLGARAAGGAVLIVAGAVLVTARAGSAPPDWLGCAAVAGACASWAIDNNLSQRLSLRDPIEVVRIKGLAAGASMLLIAWVTGQSSPTIAAAGAGLLLGAGAYGASLIFAVRALRLLGSARQAAYFATAPFIGAALSVPLLGERLDGATAIAALTMAAGVGLLLEERHAHVHTHESLEHEHAHVHDEHHRHAHAGAWSEPHSHPHRHVALTHDHPHVSDAHHRHRHGGGR
ncbi:MAG: EamA family transporter [Deltaproteobacteria bacterium]|nr:EamA family transporter [Deltaproteobacteria bacterium]